MTFIFPISNDADSANVELETDNNEVSVMHYVDKVESYDEPNRIAKDSTADSEIQKGDENSSGNTIEKKEEIKRGQLVKKYFFSLIGSISSLIILLS